MKNEVCAARLATNEDAFTFLEASDLVAGDIFDLAGQKRPVLTPWLLALTLKDGQRHRSGSLSCGSRVLGAVHYDCE